MYTPFPHGSEIPIVSFQQFRWIARFYYPASVHDNDPVKVHDCLQPVRDRENGAVLELFTDKPKYPFFCRRIHRRRHLVDDNESRPPQQCSSNGEELD